MPTETSQNQIILGAIALLAGGMISPMATALWRKLSGAQYASRKHCEEKHAQLKQDCDSCRAATKASICAIQHENAKVMKLLRLIAMQMKVPMEDLKEFL
jgi:hypothetical protein